MTQKTPKSQEKQIKQETTEPVETKESKEKLDIEEITNLLKRVQADFENYQKRVDKDREEFCRLSCKELIKKLIPLLDSFNLAIKNPESAKHIEPLYAQFTQILEKEGISSINSLNQKFDPHLHEALLQEESDKGSGIILEELQKGYALNGKVIRHSKVKVSK